MKSITRNRTPSARRGAAIVELAVCLPVLVFMVWGTIEVASSIFLKQTMISAAHEGALQGMRFNANQQQIIDRVNLILAARNISDCTVNVETGGTPFEELPSGGQFSIRVQKNQTNQFINLTGVSVSITSQRP